MESNCQLVLSQRKTRRVSTGFTLIELMIAALLLLIGIVAVAQLVPVAINRNLLNRNDSKATVVAAQVLDQILSQRIGDTQTTITVDGQNFVIQIGGPGAGNTGSTISWATGQAVLDCAGGGAVPGYSFVFFDPNNPASPGIEVRLGVITTVAGTGPVSKRFVVGAWRRDNTQNACFSQVDFDGFVQR
jgi:type II secretory pathway pseudopilin PulG